METLKHFLKQTLSLYITGLPTKNKTVRNLFSCFLYSWFPATIHMGFVYIRYLNIFGLEKYSTYVREVGPVREYFIVPWSNILSIYL